ncbi:phosphomevalonate kinase [Cololabis saira]|uniref:phosphomevalonate kinase n=1 Tax=Cololabis saira TaxID=129043 RepID=UPI002AD566EB|nr:phosphomevalonate kinase [Cololabis saira]
MENRVSGPDLVLENRVPGPDLVLENRVPGSDLVLENRVSGPDLVLENRVSGPDLVLENRVSGPDLVLENRVSGPDLVLENRVPVPELVLVFCGKRKSGKDFVTDLLVDRLGSEVCCVLRLSGPLKQQFAQEQGLDLDQLLGPGPYKERFRSDMILWGETRRNQDPGFFCRLATRDARQPVWVVSDARRLSDLRWFQSNFPGRTRSVRVQCSDQTRTQRGWSFTAGVDDAESECGLDCGVDFDWIITNEASAAALEQQLLPILETAQEAASGRRPDQGSITLPE